ncbi:MAG: acetyl-coenzyme A carboxylase carboxyl transferase subunit alpha [Rhodothalassiaceae bacterium]|nr:MAG: acetyl-coenzyme A carboxylase carboxyl transferase subunit alpha [Rhodothalassiaceae bacterium]
MTFLDFEKPIAELEGRIRDLRKLADEGGAVDLSEDVARLEAKRDRLLRATYLKLTPAQKTKVARHPERPHFRDIIAKLFSDYLPLAGDRCFGEDRAIEGGLARFEGRSVVVIGHEKGASTEERIAHNFGMGRPEGYRKAVRLMDLAERFGLPVLTFVDTPGAYPGKGAEERGQAEAIARAIERMLRLKVPTVATIMGEGGSGGAVALAAADRVLMMEHAIYSVISPEGCASILWRTADKADAAAEALKITADDLSALGVIDAVVPEPLGGAHRDPETALATLGQTISEHLRALLATAPERLPALRREKFLQMGRALARKGRR